MSESPAREEVLEALGAVRYPGFQKDIVSMGMVQDLEIGDGRVAFRLSPGSADQAAIDVLHGSCVHALEDLDGVHEVSIEIAAPKVQGPPPQAQSGEMHTAQRLPGVRSILAVASGKGGVGKSTVAVNLAAALKARGNTVGILDADIYGPSVPTMLGLQEPAQPEGARFEPMESHGLKAVSMGMFVPPEQAVIWRGPMVMKAIRQFFMDVNWGELDYLVVDLPPGTGDAQLTLVQLVQLQGAVIVTTPQEVALADARKAVSMFRRTNCPILGIVENMSYFLCPSCNEEHDIFSRGGGRAEADRLGVPFLGEIPITSPLRESGDAGRPLVVSDPDSPASRAFLEVADRVLEVVDTDDDAGEGKKRSGFWPFKRG